MTSDQWANSPARPIHVLTLTPFYPVLGDDAKGCFVAEPLRWLERLGISNSVLAVQPLYRGRVHRSGSAYPAIWSHVLLPPGNLGLGFSGAFLFANIIARVWRLNRIRQIDLIHAHAALPCGHAAHLLGRKLGIPFVVTVHGNDAYFTNQVHGRAGRWCRRTSTTVFNSAKRVICISEHVSAHVVQNPKAQPKVEVVYNGVDTEQFYPSEEDGMQRIVSVGNLISSKGHELLIRAFASVQKDFPQATLQLIGDGPQRHRLSLLVSELQISDKVVFLGRRTRADVARAIRGSVFFALPSRDEGLGCVYLEAMAAGKVAVACRSQGIEEIIEHGANGWLIGPDNLPEMIDAMRVLLSDQPLRQRLGRDARRTILENHTLAHQAETLTRIYKECLG
jgi:teichuronic acid biosynthesis glycosyltransferase TuaC